MELTDFSTSSENPVSGTFGSGWKLVCVCVCVVYAYGVCVVCEYERFVRVYGGMCAFVVCGDLRWGVVNAHTYREVLQGSLFYAWQPTLVHTTHIVYTLLRGAAVNVIHSPHCTPCVPC